MCFDPVSMAAMAAIAGGNYLQTQNNNASIKSQQNAKNAVIQEGLQQQARTQEQAGAAFNKSLDEFQPQKQEEDLGALVGKRETALNESLTPATGIDPTSNVSTAPKVVQDTLAKRLADATAFGTQQGSARARIGGRNDATLNDSLKMGDAGLDIGLLSDFAKGDARINMYKQAEAWNNARKAPSMFGQGLSTIGSLMMLPGASTAIPAAINNAPVWWSSGANLFKPDMPAGMFGPNVPSIF